MMRRPLLSFSFVSFVVAVCFSSMACAEPVESDDDGSQTEAAQTAKARAQLNAFTGLWRVDTREGQTTLPDQVLIQATDDSVDPTTGTTKGTRLRIMQAEHPTVPAIDRAPFVNVDEGKGCENTSLGGLHSLTICHETKLTDDGKTLTHTVSLTEYQGYIIPTGWSSATQVLALAGGSGNQALVPSEREEERLHYTYEIDGELAHDVMFARP